MCGKCEGMGMCMCGGVRVWGCVCVGGVVVWKCDGERGVCNVHIYDKLHHSQSLPWANILLTRHLKI